MKKVAFQILFEVEDSTNEQELKQGLFNAIDAEFDFEPNETCMISKIESFVEPPPL